jgi:hypothetical protein
MNIKKSSNSLMKALNYADKQNTDPSKYNVFIPTQNNIHKYQYGLPYNNIVPILPQIKPEINIQSIDTLCTNNGYTKITELSNPQSLKSFNDYSNHDWPVAPPSSRKSPTSPSRKSPTNPSRKSPTNPSRKSPTSPSRKSPTSPSRKSPTNPSRKSPTNPSRKSPTNPSRKSPTNPSRKSPTNSSRKSPTNPLRKSPTNPSRKLPTVLNVKKIQ